MKPILLIFLFASTNSFCQSYPDNCLDSLVLPESYIADAKDENHGVSIDFPCPPEEFSFAIYNRWGSLIYQTEDSDFIWTGTKEEGTEVSDGMYIWVLKYTFNGNDFSKTGSLNVLM